MEIEEAICVLSCHYEHSVDICLNWKKLQRSFNHHLTLKRIKDFHLHPRRPYKINLLWQFNGQMVCIFDVIQTNKQTIKLIKSERNAQHLILVRFRPFLPSIWLNKLIKNMIKINSNNKIIYNLSRKRKSIPPLGSVCARARVSVFQ